MPVVSDEIFAKCTPELIASRDTQAIADVVNVGRTRLDETLIGYGSVLSALGADQGAAVLDALEALAAVNSPVKWAMKMLSASNLDIGHPQTRAQMDVLALAGVMTAEQAEILKALAVKPDPVSLSDIVAALGE